MSELTNAFLNIIVFALIVWLALGALSLGWSVFRPFFHGYTRVIRLCLIIVASLILKLLGPLVKRRPVSEGFESKSRRARRDDVWG
jgi:hypothetical protein